MPTTQRATHSPPHPDNVHIKPEDLRKIYGGTVGGPLIKDKLFFMYTYDQHTHIFPFLGIPKGPASFFTPADTSLPIDRDLQPLPLAPATPSNGYISGTPTTEPDRPGACTLAAREGLTTYAAGANAYNTDLLGLLADEGTVPRAGYQEINTPKLDWQINSRRAREPSLSSPALGFPGRCADAELWPLRP